MKWIKKLAKRAIAWSLVLAVLSTIVWATTFIYVVPPVKYVYVGKTVWMFKPDRLFAEKTVPFICSADRLNGVQHAGVFNRLTNIITDVRVLHSAQTELLKFKYFPGLHKLSAQVR